MFFITIAKSVTEGLGIGVQSVGGGWVVGGVVIGDGCHGEGGGKSKVGPPALCMS